MLSIKVVDSISFLWENWLERGQLLKKVGKSVWYNSFIIEIVERGSNMAKQVKFGEKDLELVKRIEDFQKEQKLPSFIEAVRVFCEKGLQVNELMKY